VAAAANGEVKLMFDGESKSSLYIGYRGAADDHLWMAVDGSVPDVARFGVGRVARSEDSAGDATSQPVERFVGDLY